MSILVDDNDPLVQYNSESGGWVREGLPPEFDATVHASSTQGDTATLAFEGTSISLYGTLGKGNGQSRLLFSIDGADAGSYQGTAESAAVHNLHFWTSASLDDAPHRLVVTVDQDATLNPNHTFLLDYFVYDTTSTAGKTLLIDDGDSSITYSLNWQSVNNADDCLERTKHVSESAGSWATVTFQGTQISLVVPSSQQAFNASIIVDGSKWGPPIPQTDKSNQFWLSPLLPQGTHTINVTVLDGNPLALDYLLLTTNVDLADPSVVCVSSPTAVTSTTPTLTASSSSATASNSSPGVTPVVTQFSSSTTTKPQLLIGAVMAGPVAVFVFIVASLLAFIFIRRRKRRARDPPTRNRNSSGGSDWHLVSQWVGRNELTTAIRPFLASEAEEMEPPPYRVKHSAAVAA
ncbi:Right-handed parallel beta-helix repeat-containing protein [Mycena venus]|uniref:Right-handed parallel beta-helix repeat-containing protein n=1 Tax=Mycena venus TaxID=2733690 RepID=A0A8H7CFZ9_9AGAR|nr:Right-handed parallel beta-helix repeat-containing protein [Mycena venus]